MPKDKSAQDKPPSVKPAKANSPKAVKPLERLWLWSLASSGGEAWLDELKPVISASRRQVLISLGLVAQESRARQKPGKKTAKALWLSLTEAGWRWLGSPDPEPLNCQSPVGAAILGRVTLALTRFLADRPQGLQAVFQPEVPELSVEPDQTLDPAPAPDSEPPAQIAPTKAPDPGPPAQPATSQTPLAATAILRRLKTIAAREAEPGGALKLTVARRYFPELTAVELNQALLELQKQKALALFEMVDPMAITPEDQAAALRLAGVAFHSVFLLG
ncbi:MAG: hypothetical protein LBR11_01290 [Deltaproteobacteria bacterium]|jgi:hypothetical protein|nr:hypothetical protein [Deltaproteobacteria bacterium]